MKKTSLRRALTLGLVLAMSVSSTACKKETNDDDNKTSPTPSVGGEYKPSVTNNPDATKVPGETDTKDTYTYHDYASGSPKTWNPHEWETNEDSYIMTYTQMGLYNFQLNSAGDGYEIVPEMASGEPVDVTSKYAKIEKYGLPADATSGYAFTINLNEAACWEDGTPINADTYVYSMKQMLNPEMKNYRASTYYSGRTALANAEAYYKGSGISYEDIVVDGTYKDVTGKTIYTSTSKPSAFFGGNSMQTYYENGYAANFADADGKDLYNALKEKENEEGYIEVTDEVKAMLVKIAAGFGDSGENAYLELSFLPENLVAPDWEDVGIVKEGDYAITLIFNKPISDFYLHYGLSGNWIVYEDLYEANKSQQGSMVKTKYATSVDNYMSYGPYKLSDYQDSKRMYMEKNDKWYGYTDGKHEGQYQTTAIDCQVVETHDTVVQLFLQGKLDGISLDANDMETYRTSDYINFTPESYTTKITFNTSYDALKARETEGVNRKILSYTDFRKAFALAINRTEFATQCTATHRAGYGLLNYMYVSDPDTGEIYRNTEEAQKALCNVYGVENADEITGYDKEGAAKLFQSAYDAALAAGDIKDTDKVELEFLVYTSDEAYVKIINFLQQAITDATAGTSLEGKVTIKMTPDANYYDHAQEGSFEMILSTWGGASMDPFGITECYADPGTMFEYGFDSKTEKLTININGTDVTKTYYDWYKALDEGEYATADNKTKVIILAAFEEGILSQFRTTPLYYRTVAGLDSQRLIPGTDEFVQIVAFGGIQHLTYTMTDAEWDAYCASQNNQLTY